MEEDRHNSYPTITLCRTRVVPFRGVLNCLKSIIAKELSENDEFVHVNILKEKLRIAVDALKEIRDYNSGHPYAYCVGFLQEEARGALEKIEGE